jgi:FtsP/CotA-like multicopper oxidase with cupredoxin domain
MQFNTPGAFNYSGMYRCVIGSNEFNFNVTVISAPVLEAIEVDGVVIPLSQDKITVRLGQDLTVRCVVKGHPPPSKVHWRTPSRLLKDKGEVLHFTSVKKKDGGVYNCFARFMDKSRLIKAIKLIVLS